MVDQYAKFVAGVVPCIELEKIPPPHNRSVLKPPSAALLTRHRCASGEFRPLRSSIGTICSSSSKRAAPCQARITPVHVADAGRRTGSQAVVVPAGLRHARMPWVTHSHDIVALQKPHVRLPWPRDLVQMSAPLTL